MSEYKRKKIVLDFFGLLRAIKADKWKMCIWLGIAAILALAVAFDTPREYKSSVMLAPETSSSNSLTSNISSLASMVGMDMNFGESNDAIYPELYPDLIQSTDFLVSLFPIQVETKDGSVKTSFYDYLKNHNKQGWWNYPNEWLHNLMTSKDDTPGDSAKVDPFRLTKDQYDIAHSIGRSINCSVDKKTSVISIEVTAQDPLVAAMMADSVRNRLQAFITSYRTKKARNDLAYMEQLFGEAREQYVKARQQYAAFVDANQDVILQSYKSKEEDLENDMQLKYNAYTQIYEQLQLARAKVQERTPAFTTLQNATVPVKHSNTPKVFILILFVFLAFIVRLAILIKKNYKEVLIFQ